MNLQFWKKSPQTNIAETTAIKDGEEKTFERVRGLVKDFIYRYDHEWDVRAMTMEYSPVKGRDGIYLIITILTPRPEQIIGVKGAIAHQCSGYVSNAIGQLVYTMGVYYDPFKIPLPQ